VLSLGWCTDHSSGDSSSETNHQKNNNRSPFNRQRNQQAAIFVAKIINMCGDNHLPAVLHRALVTCVDINDKLLEKSIAFAASDLQL